MKMETANSREHSTSELTDFFPIQATRVETALSRFPIHNLTKSEQIEIRISKRVEGGKDIHWSVSPSRDFGEPRQLAYKIDTLVVNRRIDEAARPIPRIIRLGSLREICSELGLSTGKSSADVKLALQQNASAFITAKVAYRAINGVEQRFQASFTRYTLRFYGQTLPDGRRADAVYIIFNDEYLALLNNVQFRPLDYAYLTKLTPSAQRFYEIVSYRMFAALAQGRPQARLLYSDYCTAAPQLRYLETPKVQKQMYKIHRPHVQSRYIESVKYRATTDEDGKADWEILYEPGIKARAEFAAFAKSRRGEKTSSVAVPSLLPPSLSIQQTEKGTIFSELEARGISRKKVKELLCTRTDEERVRAQILWADSIVAQRGTSLRNPPGFYIHVLENEIVPPNAMKQRRPQISRAQAVKKECPEEKAYRGYREEAIRTAIETNLAAEFEQLAKDRRRELERRFPDLKPDSLQLASEAGARSTLEKAITLLSFEEFKARPLDSPKESRSVE